MTAAKGLQQMNFKPDEYVHAVAERVGKSNKKMEQTNKSEVLRLDDFVAYLPKHNYVFLPTREPCLRPALMLASRPSRLSTPMADPRSIRMASRNLSPRRHGSTSIARSNR